MTPLSFHRRLQDIEVEFFTALTCGSELISFDLRWSTLRSDLVHARNIGMLEQADIDLAYSVASNIAYVTQSILDLELEADNMSSALFDEFVAAFSSLGITDDEPHPRSRTTQTPYPKKRGSQKLGAHRDLPPYRYNEYNWIVHHMHNPYPSQAVKRSFAQASHTTIQSANNWFQAIRKHVGWVAFCKSHYKGSRALAVEAASAFFLKGETTHLTSAAALDLLAIQTKLINLYASEDIIGAGELTSYPLDIEEPLITTTPVSETLPRLSPTPSLVHSLSDDSGSDDAALEACMLSWGEATPRVLPDNDDGSRKTTQEFNRCDAF